MFFFQSRMVLHFPNKLTEEEQALMVIFINFFKIFNERKWDIESSECVCVCVRKSKRTTFLWENYTYFSFKK